MDGRMNEWMDLWMSEWMDERIEGRMNVMSEREENGSDAYSRRELPSE